MMKVIPLFMLLTASSLIALPASATDHDNFFSLEKSPSFTQVKKKLQISPRNLKQGLNKLQINSREWVEMTVKDDYVTEVIMKNQNGRSSRLKIKAGSIKPPHVTGEGYWYFKSNGCVCWEDEEGQQSVCSDACFN
ncbi:MAG: hypothetical protein VKL59_21825 [Nostocaceae cyanobacterium]|nr:hypothetical protein [Nostocaceae cyanobacterium]